MPTDALTKDGWAARKTYPGPGAHKERELVAGSMAAAFANCRVLFFGCATQHVGS